ncbi:MAG: YaaA family protein, partial [Muribaculaceae bacterium]|nr:YaaA family protein [Muribaculaceae bacterium]
MLILIAESKTMLEQELPVSRECYEANTPAGEAFADETMSRVADMDVADIAAAIKISPAMAAKVIRMAYEFPNKQTGLRAIDAFTGVVFKNFGYSSLSPEEKERTAANVRIISSLYGWLRPEDIIKPYRFDFNTPLAPDDKTFAAWWRKDVTIHLVRQLKATGKKNILNLLPADAAKCIDWKLVKNFAKVWKVDFKEHDGSAVRTPHAGKLKALRGYLLREIITQNITSPTPLLTLE